MQEFIKTLSQNFISKPIAFVLTITALPLINVLQSIPRVIQAFNNIRFEIMDKLSAVFGELKAALNKKFEKFVENIKKPFEWISKIFKKYNSDDDDTKIDDDKKIFNLKTLLQKIKEKWKDNENEHGTENQ